jgi:hypothetical protein
MNEPWWVNLLREQEAAQFADVAGAHLAITLPVTDRLVTRLISSRLPASLPIKELDVRAAAGNQIAVRVRLLRPAFLPAFTIGLIIERQPLLPSSPVLVLRIGLDAMGALAGMAMRFLQVLPPGLRMDGDRLYVDLATCLARYGAAEVLEYLTSFELTTTEGRFVVNARAVLPKLGGEGAGATA